MKKVLALIMALVMIFSLSACGRFEMKMASALTQLQNADSVSAETILDVNVGIQMGTETMDIPVENHAVSVINTKPLKVHTNAQTSIAGGDAFNSELYIVQRSDKLSLYFRNETDNKWSVSSTKMPVSATIPAGAFGRTVAMSQISSYFTEAEPSKKNLISDYIFEGIIPGSAVNAFLERTNSKAKLAEALGGIDVNALDFSRFGDLPVSIVINKDSVVITQIRMDLTDWLNAALKIAMAESAKEDSKLEVINGLMQLGTEFTINSAFLTINLSDYNSAGTVVIPDALVKS